MKIHVFVTDLTSALTFLTRLRAPAALLADSPPGARAAWAYPLAAAIATIPSAAVFAILAWLGAGALLSALMGLLVSIMIGGSLHEDGLSDAADGLFGGATRERALEIMKDSHAGAFGVVALVLSILIRATALAGLLHYGIFAAALLFIATAAAGRAGLVLHWGILPAARKEGAAATMGRPGVTATVMAVVTAIILCLAIGLLTRTAASVLLALAFTGIATLCFCVFVNSRIGGHTGDTLGATEQIGEIVFLLTLAIAA